MDWAVGSLQLAPLSIARKSQEHMTY
uniref:Uncharacterized protein n=1 Tax=Arundo donax TaxID=35708 RepID=A0A0A9B5V7_ARUDO